MGQLSVAPLRALRTIYMERIGLSYWAWRRTPWYVIMDAWGVWDSQARANEAKAKRRNNKRRPKGGSIG